MARNGGSAQPGERRGRGEPAAAVLRSEADFSEPGLSRERRWLALFLLVHLVDDNGRMSTAYRRVLRRAARTPGHWAHGRSLGAVRAEVTRWIGAQARPECVPPWERVASLVHAAVHPTLVPEVVATARYLHGLVVGVATDDPRPRWLDPEVDDITTTMIGGPEWARKHGLAAPADRGSGDAAAGGGGLPTREARAYEMLWTVVRVHRDAEARIAELEHQVRQLHEENARLSGDVTTWLGDYRPAIPDQDRGSRRRPVADRHLADRHRPEEDPARSFTYPLPVELPASQPSAG
ncbi:hypothetical protein IOD16_36195 [Saccharothrix sp. 6-C]|uniref:hypothetical protein n=1 Tax=Saccharothrix sp. 6-C TaxID=2781735 RepID=UPI00191782D4|nr:hypothetical protein [Saccharothrix sp. 6-C]QQQ76395.1 hypothetical protein IOD16_36195 [Saccharothrix sp. 6-C]